MAIENRSRNKWLFFVLAAIATLAVGLAIFVPGDEDEYATTDRIETEVAGIGEDTATAPEEVAIIDADPGDGEGVLEEMVDEEPDLDDVAGVEVSTDDATAKRAQAVKERAMRPKADARPMRGGGQPAAREDQQVAAAGPTQGELDLFEDEPVEPVLEDEALEAEIAALGPETDDQLIALSPVEEPYEPLVERDEESLFAGMGLGLTLGAGVTGFTDAAINDFTDVGGGWQARAVLGTRTMFGVEAAYQGTANDLDGAGANGDSTLVSNGLESALRLNLIADAPLQPYLNGGVAWKRYEVMGATTRTANAIDDDDVFELPLGGGLAYRHDDLVIDARASWRPAFDDEIANNPALDTGDADLDSWAAGVNLGMEF